MKLILLRMLPLLTALGAAALAFWQWREPMFYPIPLFALLAWYLVAAAILLWRRVDWREGAAKILPSVLALSAVALGFLLAEAAWQRWILTLLFAGLSFLMLELLYLLTRDPMRYPVNALSRLNIALVPLTTFFAAASLHGLFIFLDAPWWAVLTAFTVCGVLLFFLTNHPTADRSHKRRWGAFGGLIGLHAGILGLLLPVTMAVHGALAALLVAFPLRMRRYAFQPVPSRTHAWGEGLGAIVLFVSLLLTSRWA